MKQLILTGYDAAMSSIGDLTSPLMAAYADRHGLDFRCNRDYSADAHPAFQKIEFVIKAFRQDYEWVSWLDADAVITNILRLPTLHRKAMHASRDWGTDAGPCDFSTGVFIAHRDTLPMFEKASLLRQYEWEGYYDQGALRQVCADSETFRQMTCVQPRRWLNAVPASTIGVVEPWQPGDFCCHLTGTGTIERRVEVFHEIAEKAGL